MSREELREMTQFEKIINSAIDVSELSESFADSALKN